MHLLDLVINKLQHIVTNGSAQIYIQFVSGPSKKESHAKEGTEITEYIENHSLATYKIRHLVIGSARIVQRFSIKTNPQFHIKARGGKTWEKGHTSYMYEVSDFCT
jgi:hypothetical protein